MATVPKLMADGVAGVVAVYDIDDSNPSDRDPLDDPLTYLSRVHFHSDLLYPIIKQKYTGTLALPSRAVNLDVAVVSHTLFAHGLAGQPLVFGRILDSDVNSGAPVPLAGSVPIQTQIHGFGRWLNLGADATNVKMAETYVTHNSAGFAAMSVNWEVWVTHLFLDQSSPLPSPTGELLYIDETSFRAGEGKFDASDRFIRTANTGKEFAVVKGGKTVHVGASGDPYGSTAMWRYSVDGYVQQHTHLDQGNLGNLALTLQTFNASVEPARTE